MKHIEDNNYENMFWGYAENEKDFTDFLLSLWNKKDYEWYRNFSMRIANVFQNEESIFFDDINAEISPEMHYEDNEYEYIEYPSPTETNKYTIGKKPKESEYPVVLLYDVANDRDRVFTWVSLNEFKGVNNESTLKIKRDISKDEFYKAIETIGDAYEQLKEQLQSLRNQCNDLQAKLNDRYANDKEIVDEISIKLNTMKNPDTEFATDDYIDGFSDGISAAIKELEAFPTADVQPVKHGRWIINSDGYYPQCSECMNEPQGRIMTDFCPNCGARMDKK